MAFKKSNNTESTKPSYEVLEKCGVISENGDWKTELRYVSWNGREPKYDIRPWKDDPDGEKCGKGITLTGQELEALLGILKEMEE
jgi:hypothetical protein